MKKALEKQLNKFDDKTDKLIVKVLEEQNIPPAFIAVICADVKTLNEQFLTDFYHKIREEERKEIVEIGDKMKKERKSTELDSSLNPDLIKFGYNQAIKDYQTKIKNQL